MITDWSCSQHRMSCMQEDAVQYYWVVGYDVSTGFEILNDFSCSKHRMSCRIVHFSAIGWLVTVLALVKLRF